MKQLKEKGRFYSQEISEPCLILSSKFVDQLLKKAILWPP
jgi:hypothetical protein